MRSERRGPFHELTSGARAVVDGLVFVFRAKGALRTALVPMAIAVGIGFALAGLGLWGVVAAGASVFGTTGALSGIGRALFDVALGGLVLFASVVVALAIAQPLARAALSRLTGALTREIRETGMDPAVADASSPSSTAFASIATALGTVGITLPTIGALEAITVPAPELAFVTEPLAFLVAALGLAYELFDHPMSRRGWSFGQRLRWMKQNAMLVIGFAVSAEALLMLPVADLFLLPVGILAATKLVAMRDGPPPPPKLVDSR